MFFAKWQSLVVLIEHDQIWMHAVAIISCMSGAEKALLFDFTRPDDPSSGGRNPNMPAIWALNAQIPRVGDRGADWGSFPNLLEKVDTEYEIAFRLFERRTWVALTNLLEKADAEY
ncbi:hypothetical protein EJ06DRAFT_525107 [Trichodelitschia bisporula]|uniref:Cell wall protein YJL171C/Tos1 C-terminal domain-containing protein n=1 Tax=Trichodelitschia bisporula TaxID=703511 RepID=A0A6G1HJ47_9PEZI|nr:hypothetical protein EJ06DRAFT_525107 [Trichodelitschia bisporula]